MTRIQRLMRLHRLMGPTNGDGGDGGGSGGGGAGDGQGSGGEGQGQGKEDDASDKGAGEGEGGEGGEKTPKVSDAEAALLKELMTKKTALTKANEKLAQVNAQLEQYAGLDVAKARAALAAAEEAERAQAEARGDYDKLKTQMAASHAAEKTALEGQVQAAGGTIGALQKQIADLTVGGAFNTSAFIGEDLTLPVSKARALYGAHFEFKDGQLIGYDKAAGADGRAPLVDGAGNPLSFDAALKKIVDADPDREQLYRSKVKAGAGSSTKKAPGKTTDDIQKANLSGTDRIAAALAARKKK
jgi:hypothetical protein